MPETGKTGDDADINNDLELEALLDKVFSDRNFDFRDYKKASVKRRIRKRMDVNHISSYIEYAEFLQSHPGEYLRLFNTLLINVTEFFRDPEAWKIIEKDVLPDILSKKRKGDCIRVWSAACSSGEEPFTIGILLAEALGSEFDDFEIRIYATDIDDDVLVLARKGIYAAEKLSMIGPEILRNYFMVEDNEYRISRSIRQMVSFGRQDLTMDAPISQLDLLICRNVLMYFNSNLQNRLMHRFDFAVRDGGYIFLGKSEGTLIGSKLFRTVDNKWKIYQKNTGR
ncbi:MAG TPA: protein-glutamate O-methyltransferase CheR [Methanocella sp.]|nr:protein-glutamate O-methyltransferase CheR [Methanocella sp.]